MISGNNSSDAIDSESYVYHVMMYICWQAIDKWEPWQRWYRRERDL